MSRTHIPLNDTLLRAFIDEAWRDEVLPALCDYITIPAVSPAFDPDWERRGSLGYALALLAHWTGHSLASVDGVSVEVVDLPGRTASLFIDIPGDSRPPILFYGHYDKQPAMDGWAEGRGAWKPRLEGDRLYGRGGADDGYAIFSVVTAVLALRAQGLSHPPVRVLIEGSEESGSGDLEPTLDHLADRIGVPALVVVLDGSCGDYDRFWTMTSLRGQVAGTLTVRTLEEAVHSGDASGVIPSPLRIARSLLDRLEDVGTGEIPGYAFNVDIPQEVRRQAGLTAAVMAPLHEGLPLVDGGHPVTEDPVEQLLNRAWRPQLAVTGLEGLPTVADAAPVFHPAIRLKLSLRLPPVVEPEAAGKALKALLERDPPHNARVGFTVDMASPGWAAPPLAPALADLCDDASRRTFGLPAASLGGGGGIPFLSMLGRRFPAVQFLVTGVLGPESNAHGPNEFLHLPAARNLTAALAHILQRFEEDAA